MAISRREFLYTMTAAAAGPSLSKMTADRAAPAAGTEESRRVPGKMTIQEAIETILRDLPTDPIHDTVDTVKAGDTTQPLSGIATTFLATAKVISEAASRGANLVITHEPTFYNHRDEVDWLENDSVYQAKTALLEREGVVVWRLHDHMHRSVHDDMTEGIIRTLGWTDYASPEDNYLCTVPETSLTELASYIGRRVESNSVRTVGEPAMACSNVGILMGAWGGRRQIEMLSRPDVDVVVCGEVNEWETAEYARDARELGVRKGLVVVGHAVSEEPGMLWFAEWIRKRIDGVDVFHLPAEDPFEYL